ncbi:YceK/YidQ family lipoprotein [Brenneria izbisi]|uniref:YceK/YidQ family lipoprotein n=1 Tax=Brenneria izbisi TaxID=2939450 RepID=A0AA42C2A9_9GAMM|nr:YceK/YidQ family lipoprotein [Brenneria izbisi]MCV9878948.1 YceK/YidQ family lipoprotein [Brenneria izbisi]MCV9882388.1 YceK/YidQ family lipoprotein [Brenneria izbisi]
MTGRTGFPLADDTMIRLKTAILKRACFSFIITSCAITSLSGCSSVMTRTGSEQGYYSGTRASMDMLRDDDTSWAMLPLVALDLPFSAAADTLLLPYDYYRSGHDHTSMHDRIHQSEQENQSAGSPPTTAAHNQL